MVIFKKTFLFLFVFSLICCQDTQTNSKKKEAQKQVKDIPLKKSNDSIKTKKNKNLLPIITNENVVEFLTEYGKNNKETKAIIKTRLGDIHIELFKDTPLHRANFIFLVKNGYYNTTCFHRVVEDFIIQAGQSDNSKTVELRKKIGSYRIPQEINQHPHHKGVLSAARRWNQNPLKKSDAFEFFIVHQQKGLHHLNKEHTAFGKVTKGLKVVDKIAKETIDKGEWPLTDVRLNIQLK